MARGLTGTEPGQAPFEPGTQASRPAAGGRVTRAEGGRASRAEVGLLALAARKHRPLMRRAPWGRQWLAREMSSPATEVQRYGEGAVVKEFT